uniref:Uncharacterized protein n=1 Tax=Anguilla anguilla TaxID=7936 RepID=A0A0E9WTQ6_ANGAN
MYVGVLCLTCNMEVGILSYLLTSVFSIFTDIQTERNVIDRYSSMHLIKAFSRSFLAFRACA